MLSKLINLKKLNLESCYDITNDGLLFLNNLINLVELDLSETNISKIELKYLKILRLEGCNIFNIHDNFKFLYNLEELSLSRCINIMDKDLEFLSTLINLKILNLSECKKITDDGLEYLSKLPNLKILNLSSINNITNIGLEYLSKLSNLLELYLDNTKIINITDIGLEHLSKLSNLQILTMVNCTQITDVGIEYLSRLPNLKKLDLSHCDKITNLCLTYFINNNKIPFIFDYDLPSNFELTMFGCYNITKK